MSVMGMRVRDLLFDTVDLTGRVPRDDFMTGGALASLRRRVVTVGMLEATGSFLVPHYCLRRLDTALSLFENGSLLEIAV